MAPLFQLIGLNPSRVLQFNGVNDRFKRSAHQKNIVAYPKLHQSLPSQLFPSISSNVLRALHEKFWRRFCRKSDQKRCGTQ